ncbi:MAG: pentapeptide repeat-containing protein [Planctomycetes bacterium]|nr:pentapeptide repeat-containing protein [Planctomycetota bacterium]
MGEVVLGSTRSGLLVGAPPSWGTRTGFYSADFQDHDRLPPETIRKANLQRADLRGAHVLECDFYLVDLRGAAFTHEQGQHFRKCGAILDRRPD